MFEANKKDEVATEKCHGPFRRSPEIRSLYQMAANRRCQAFRGLISRFCVCENSTKSEEIDVLALFLLHGSCVANDDRISEKYSVRNDDPLTISRSDNRSPSLNVFDVPLKTGNCDPVPDTKRLL